MTPGPGIEPGPHWWEASAITTAPSLLPERTERENLKLSRNERDVMLTLPQVCSNQHNDENYFFHRSIELQIPLFKYVILSSLYVMPKVQWPHHYYHIKLWRPGGVMVSALISGFVGLGLTGLGALHCALYCHSASLHPGV